MQFCLGYVWRLLWLLHRDWSSGHHVLRPLNWKEAEQDVERLWHPHFKHFKHSEQAKKNGGLQEGHLFSAFARAVIATKREMCETHFFRQGFLRNAELRFILFPCLDWSAQKALIDVSSSWSWVANKLKTSDFAVDKVCLFKEILGSERSNVMPRAQRSPWWRTVPSFTVERSWK